MAITRMTYCNRDDAQRSIDFKDGIDVSGAMDRALRSSTENIEAHLHRTFYPLDTTYFWDWPNQGGSGGGQYANPWRLWFDQKDCVVLTAFVTGGQVIPLNQVFLEPVNKRPGWPFTYLELDRSSTAAFGGNSPTPQHSIVLTGTWGFGADADQVAALGANVGNSDATVTLSDGADVGPGDLLILGYGRGAAPFPSAAGYAGAVAPFTGERVLVTGRLWSDSTQAQQSGCSTAVNSDNVLTVTDGTKFTPGEVIRLDTEQMLITDASGNNLVVRRAWNGTILNVHGGAEVYVSRTYTVARAQYGTTAASYSSGAAVFKHRVPGLVRDLCIAESANRLLQEGAGYARTVGSGEAAVPASGLSLADLWDETVTAYGRKARIRAV